MSPSPTTSNIDSVWGASVVLTDPQGNRVLVQTDGHINLIVETAERGRRLARLSTVLPVLAMAIVLATLLSSALTFTITMRVRNDLEARLMDRIAQLNDHLDAVAGDVGAHVQRESDRVADEVVRVGDRLDRIPAKLDAVAQGTSDTIIAWISSLKQAPNPPPLVVRAAGTRRK